MRVVADECVPAGIIAALRDAGHQVVAIRELAPSASDDEVLSIALELDQPLLTEDLDFGEMVFRRSLTSAGVIMLRLSGLPTGQKAAILLQVINTHVSEIAGAFVVVTPGTVRIRRNAG